MSAEKKVGFFFLLAVVILIVLLESVQDKPFFSRSYFLKTYFHSVTGLEKSDPVRLAGLKVGEIKDIKLSGDKVEVLLSIYENVPVRTTSEAAIKMTSLLGGKYLDLSLGATTDPVLKEGETINSVDAPDLDELLAKINEVVSDVQGFTGNVLADGGEDFKAALESVNRMTKKIEAGEGTLGRLITDESLYEEARKAAREVGKAAEGVQDQTPLIAFTSVLFGIAN